jgi:hypothetical protein
MLISRDVGRFTFDRTILTLLMLVALLAGVRGWLAEHPQHDPFAPLNLNDPPGWATQRKLASLRDDPQACHAVLERSGVAFSALPPTGSGECARPDRTVLADALIAPAASPSTCAVAAGVEVWLRQGVQPAAETILRTGIARVEHLGIYSCRRVNGGETGNWSEHATGNAIDIAAFVLEDGRRISVRSGWNGDTEERAFLRQARDAACDVFGTVLSPDYNAAHADHFHLDQAARGFGGFCR